MKQSLICCDEIAALEVVTEWEQYGGQANTVTVNAARPDVVDIEYFDKRYPLDVASWAFENGQASDGAAARVIGSL